MMQTSQKLKTNNQYQENQADFFLQSMQSVVDFAFQLSTLAHFRHFSSL